MRPATIIIPLAELLRLDAETGRRHVEEALAGFTCERDGAVVEDVVDFIRHKAIPFEENRICRTFLSVVESDLSVGTLTVLGYFTLQYIQSEANGESLAMLSDDLKRIIASNYNSTSGVLLAQIARDSRYGPDVLDGATLLMNAERQARLVCDYVGGELIYLDCGEPLRDYYIDKGYIEIEEVSGKEGEESYYKMQKELYPERSPILKALVDGASREPD